RRRAPPPACRALAELADRPRERPLAAALPCDARVRIRLAPDARSGARDRGGASSDRTERRAQSPAPRRRAVPRPHPPADGRGVVLVRDAGGVSRPVARRRLPGPPKPCLASPSVSRIPPVLRPCQ